MKIKVSLLIYIIYSSFNKKNLFLVKIKKLNKKIFCNYITNLDKYSKI
jgi:hypothetical protein